MTAQHLRRFGLAGIAAAFLLLPGLPAKPAHHDRDLPVRDEQVIRKTFNLSGSGKLSLDVDNVTGSIEVVGTDSNQVQLVVNRATRARSQEALALANKEVTLEIAEDANSVKLVACHPRCDCDSSGRRNCRSDRPDYVVKMDFQLQVPRNIDLTVRTVNAGHVAIRDVKGAFTVRNVNGSIEMQRVAGSGSAATVNGSVKVTFRENPRENSSFESVNGDIDLQFQRGLSADFRFKTFNGSVYSDFVFTSLPSRSIEQVKRGGKTVFRADRAVGGRVGSGGMEIQVENLNGDIRIRETHE